MSKFIDKTTLKNKATLPWIEKYRPEYINQVVSHESILNILKNLIEKNNFPHLLMYGPPGSGKTTTIKACAREMFGENYPQYVLELNGSSDRGIGIIRSLIDVFCQHEIDSMFPHRQKLVILDEADSMTVDAQSALRNVITTHTKTTRFCLICNYNTKIIESLISRCTVCMFSPIPENQHLQHLKNIVKYEKINIDDETLSEAVKISKGDMRNSINVLQSLSMSYGMAHITIHMLYDIIGQLEPQIMDSIIAQLLDPSLEFDDIVIKLRNMEITQSLNIIDIITMTVNYIIENKTYDVDTTVRMLLEFEQLEHNMSIGSTSYIQLCAVASVIKNHS